MIKLTWPTLLRNRSLRPYSRQTQMLTSCSWENDRKYMYIDEALTFQDNKEEFI